MKVYYHSLSSPVGELMLMTDGETLQAVSWEKDARDLSCLEYAHRSLGHPVLRETARQLQEYFAGKRTDFRLPLPETLPGTAFQNRVWKALRQIPFGETVCYQELARRIGSPLACRAVGMANHKNPIAVIIPCHRVIGKSGDLVGYGGGLDKKQFLLQLEAK